MDVQAVPACCLRCQLMRLQRPASFARPPVAAPAAGVLHCPVLAIAER